MRRLPQFVVLLATLAAFLVVPLATHAQVGAKRLILKDGSYQLATKWEIQGDRVHYYSAERFEWEDVPNSMVDWWATNNWAEDQKNNNSVTKDIEQIDAEDAAERQAEEAKTPTVAPGLKLPDNGGVYLLDNYRGQPQLAEVVQSGGEIDRQMGRNILRATLNPFAGAKQSIELKGPHARIQSHLAQPAIFVNVEEDPNADASASKKGEEVPHGGQRFRLIRAQERKDSRVIGNLKVAITGRLSQQQEFLPVDVQPVSGGWYKLTPTAPLKPGEYAVVEMLGPKEMNLYVWDFGYDPAAPANATAWKPVQAPSTATGTSDSPILGKRH